MERNVIYFPYIRVPESEWFTRILLYWDRIGSIVPHEYIRSPRLGVFMNRLISEGLVRQIIPKEYIHDISYFTEAFLDYVDSPKYPIPRNVINTPRVSTLRLHMDKLDSLSGELCRRGLAHRGTRPWYHVEYYTAHQFMAYLAAVLGKLPEINSEPTTDTVQNINSFQPFYHPQGKISHEIDTIRTIALNDILPAPQSGISPQKLIRFKAEHGKHLVRFRNKIETFLTETAAIDNQDYRDRRIAQFLDNTRDEIKEIEELMREKNWKNITFGRFLAYSSAIAGITTTAADGNIISIVVAAFGTGATIYNVIESARTEDVLEGKYAAYAVLARREFKQPILRYA